METKTTAKKIKSLFEEMEYRETICDKRLAEYEADFDNKELEAAFDAAYQAEFIATTNLINELVKIGYDAKTWRKVIATKRQQVRELCNGLQK